jgi:hypothetical protein
MVKVDKSFYNMFKRSVYALIDDDAMMVLLSFSVEIQASIGRLNVKIRDGKFKYWDVKSSNNVRLETLTNLGEYPGIEMYSILYMIHDYWKGYYEGLGYKVVIPMPFNPKVEVVISDRNRSYLRVDVRLVTASVSIVVGTYGKIADADSFADYLRSFKIPPLISPIGKQVPERLDG